MLQRPNCPHLEEAPGKSRIGGGSYPSYAQGAYLSGDGPRLVCRKCKEPCDGGECSYYVLTQLLCPDCLCDMRAAFLVDRDGQDLFCPACENEYQGRDIPGLYLEAVESLKDEADRAVRMINLSAAP